MYDPHGGREPRENHLNMLVGIVNEPEDQVKDEMFAGVCLHIDGGLCCIILNSKTTFVKDTTVSPFLVIPFK